MSEPQFNCLNCDFKTTSEKVLLSHVVKHKNEANFRIKCCHCPQISKKLNSHQKHIKICLNPKPKLAVKETNPTPKKEFYWQCQICNVQININCVPDVQDFDKIKSHCYNHAKEDAFPPCPVCGNTYTVRSF